jgi:hypothetical protein
MELLQKPEYLHVVLNHLPIWGVILGAFALGISLLLKSRTAQITALAIVLVGGVAAFPVFVTGEQAYKPIRSLTDDPGSDWLDTHMERAEQWIGVFYVLAAVALAGIVVPIKWPKSAVPLAVAALVLALLSIGIGFYIAEAGGQIRHPEFRLSREPQPDPSPNTH